MRIHWGHIVIAAVWGVGLPAWSIEGNGLQATDSSWFGSRWQARFEWSLGASRRYHVDPYNLAADTPRSAAASTSSRPGSVTAGSAQGLAGQATHAGWAHPRNDITTVPYLGVGYTALPSRSGWGFRADFGLMALRPQSAVQFGSALSGAQDIDELLREMRLSPLIQIGVSYAF